MAIDVRAVRAAKVFDRDDRRVKREPTMPARNATVAIVTAEANIALTGSAKQCGTDTTKAEPASLMGTGQHGKTNDCCHGVLQSSIKNVSNQLKPIPIFVLDRTSERNSSAPKGEKKIARQYQAKSQEHEEEQTRNESVAPPNLLFADGILAGRSISVHLGTPWKFSAAPAFGIVSMRLSNATQVPIHEGDGNRIRWIGQWPIEPKYPPFSMTLSEIATIRRFRVPTTEPVK